MTRRSARCLFAFISLAAASEVAAGNLLLQAELEHSDYLLAEPVLLRLTLTNPGTEPVSLVQAPNAPPAPYWRIGVRSPDGSAARYRGELLEWLLPGPSPHSLAAGEAVLFSYDLGEAFDLARPGRYAAAVQYDAEEFAASGTWPPAGLAGLSLSSNEVHFEFTIRKPSDPETKALQALTGDEDPRVFRTCCFPVDRLARFLCEHPLSAYAPFAKYWLARAMPPGMVEEKTTAYGEAIEALGASWLGARATLELAIFWQRREDLAKYQSLLNSLIEKFPDSPDADEARSRLAGLPAPPTQQPASAL